MAGAREAYVEEDATADAAESAKSPDRRCGVEVLSLTADIGSASARLQSNMSPGVPLPDAESAQSLELRGGVEVLSSTADIRTATTAFNCKMAAGVPLPDPQSAQSIELLGGVEVLPSTADIRAATAVFTGNMAPGVPPPDTASVLAGARIVMERSVERVMPTSVECAGETSGQSDGVVGTNRSISSQGGAEYPVESTPVPTVEAGLGGQNLLVASGVCAGEAMVNKGPGTAATMTTECANSRLLGSSAGKKRKRSISGPDARIAPNEEPAMTKAIRTWENRRNDPIFIPYKGTVFNSFEEAKEFYNLYSWEVGFGIRISRDRKNDNGYITKKDICCSCAGGIGGVAERRNHLQHHQRPPLQNGR